MALSHILTVIFGHFAIKCRPLVYVVSTQRAIQFLLILLCNSAQLLLEQVHLCHLLILSFVLGLAETIRITGR